MTPTKRQADDATNRLLISHAKLPTKATDQAYFQDDLEGALIEVLTHLALESARTGESVRAMASKNNDIDIAIRAYRFLTEKTHLDTWPCGSR